MDKTEQPLYNKDQAPAKHVIWSLGLQYLIKFSLTLICPILIGKAAGLPLSEQINLVSVSLIAAVISTLLTSCKKFIGAHRFIPSQISISFFALSLLAAKIGGLPLVFGITIIGGLAQILASSLFAIKVKFWNFQFAGFLILIIGFWMSTLGISELFYPLHIGQLLINEHSSGHHFVFSSAWVGVVALAIMIIMQLRATGRIYCILAGMLGGWILAWIFNQISPERLAYLHKCSWFAWPHLFHNISYKFDAKLIPIAIIIGIVASFEIFAMIGTLQSTENPNPNNPNLKQIAKGNIASGIGITISGIIGGVAQSPIPGSIGDLISTGVQTRLCAYTYSLFIFIIAFSPKLAILFLTIPASVNGAAIIFMGSALILKGFDMLELNKLSPNQSLAISLSLMIALAANIIPQYIHNINSQNSILSFITNPMLFAGVIAFITLTNLFKLKLRKTNG